MQPTVLGGSSPGLSDMLIWFLVRAVEGKPSLSCVRVGGNILNQEKQKGNGLKFTRECLAGYRRLPMNDLRCFQKVPLSQSSSQ